MSPLSSGSDLEPPDVLFEVTETTQVGQVRRATVALAGRLGFDDTACGTAALVATETASNLVKHGGGGRLVLRARHTGGLELIALDQGPGMTSPERCFRDGYSTAGTPGTGLGAIQRLSSFLDLYSRKPGGTALVARLEPPSAPAAALALELGVLCLPKAGEPVSGDGWGLVRRAADIVVFMADGLGHGEFAASATRAALRIYRAHVADAPVQLVEAVHSGLRSTRGAAVAVAVLDLQRQQVRYVGVGNLGAAVISGAESQRLVSHNGTAGAEARKIQEFVYPFPRGALLLMHSDGIATHWSLDAYPGLVARDPALVAGVLFRDFTRNRDDATVLAVRDPALEPS